jgi:Predicted dehydrogenases and related proteins
MINKPIWGDSMLNIGILGAGFMGRTHLNCYLRNINCKVRYIFDKNRVKAKSLGEEYGIEATDDINLLTGSDIDAVDICLPTFLHREYVEIASRAKKHILCEKPMAMDEKECNEIIDIVNENKVFYMVAHVLRFWPEYSFIKSITDSGTLGQPIYAIATRMQPMPGWSENNWIISPELSNGGVVDLQVHDLDFIPWLLGKPKSLKSIGTKSAHGAWEQVITVMEHENGAKSCIDACNLMPQGYPFTARFKILFSEGCIEYDCNQKNTLAVYHKGKQPEYPDFEGQDGYQKEVDYFVDCIISKKAGTIVRPEDARNALVLALKTKESIETKKSIEL